MPSTRAARTPRYCKEHVNCNLIVMFIHLTPFLRFFVVYVLFSLFQLFAFICGACPVSLFSRPLFWNNCPMVTYQGRSRWQNSVSALTKRTTRQSLTD
jgi:hypothetical protein